MRNFRFSREKLCIDDFILMFEHVNLSLFATFSAAFKSLKGLFIQFDRLRMREYGL